MLFQVVVSESESHATRDSQVLKKGIALSKSNLFSPQAPCFFVNMKTVKIHFHLFSKVDAAPGRSETKFCDTT